MILINEIKVPLNGQNIKYYESIGYDIPRDKSKDNRKNRFCVPKGATINVKVSHLPKGSNIIVPCKCDYCGKQFDRMYFSVVRGRKSGNLKDSCDDKKCIREKQQDTCVIKYGSTSQVDICNQNGSKLGRFLKYNLDYYISEFKKYGKSLCVDMIDDINNIKTKDNLPFICDTHPNMGVQYVTYDNMTGNIHCCKYGAIESQVEKQSSVSIDDASAICNDRQYIFAKNIKTMVFKQQHCMVC